MRAIIAQDGKPTLTERPMPQPKADEVLIAVKATALNRADLLQVKGAYPPPPGAPDILGLELAGDVLAVGNNVRGVDVNDRVMALVSGGGYAERAVVHHQHVMPIPDGMRYSDAAAIPEAFLTAYSNMIDIGGLTHGERVLIHAGASGVGLAAIQMAKAVGATVIVTASAPKHGICKSHGADMTIDYKTEDFAERILAAYSGVHLIVDMVGAPYWDDNVRVLEKWGRLVFVGLQGGASHTVNFGAIMAKRLKIMGSTLRNRRHDLKSQLIADFSAWGLPLFAERKLKPTVWNVMALEEVEAAHNIMRQNKNAGKIVLTI